MRGAGGGDQAGGWKDRVHRQMREKPAVRPAARTQNRTSEGRKLPSFIPGRNNDTDLDKSI